MIEDNVAGYYFIGRNDSEPGIGRLDSDGSLQWFKKTVFVPQDLHAAIVVTEGVMSVGGHDSDSDGEEDHGYISLYHPDGHLINNEVFSDDAGEVWLRSLALLSDTVLVAVGGIEISAEIYPFVTLVDVTDAGELVERARATISGLPGVCFQNVATDLSVPPQNGDVTVFLSGGRGGDAPNITVHAIVFPADNLDQIDIKWTQDIRAYPGVYTGTYSGNTMSLLGENLYLVGETDDDKTPGPASGGSWVSGLAASVSKSGQVNWIEVVSLSQTSDTFNGLFVTEDALYAVGEYSHFYNIPSQRDFGLGWLSKIRLETGEVISNMSFGNVRYDARFYTAWVRGTSAYCAGWTVDGVDNAGYRCWFAEVDLSQPPSWKAPISTENIESVMSVNDSFNKRHPRGR